MSELTKCLNGCRCANSVLCVPTVSSVSQQCPLCANSVAGMQTLTSACDHGPHHSVRVLVWSARRSVHRIPLLQHKEVERQQKTAYFIRQDRSLRIRLTHWPSCHITCPGGGRTCCVLQQIEVRWFRGLEPDARCTRGLIKHTL